MDSKINKNIITVVGNTPIEDIVFDGPTYDDFILEQEKIRKESQDLKESAIQKLKKLGLTEDEAKAIAGL